MFNLPPMTRALILLLIGIGAVDWLVGGNISFALLFWGFEWSPFVLWHAFTSAFVHASLAHLALNVAALAIFGSVLEPRVGGRWFLGLFVAGAVAGPLTHAAFDSAPVLGASAGNGALAGAGLVLARRQQLGRHGQLMALFASLFLLTSLIGFVLPVASQIANAAHLGGFLVGALLATRIRPRRLLA